MQNELQWLDSLSPTIKNLLEAAHDIDRTVLERMTTLSLESPTQPVEPVPVPVPAPPTSSQVAAEAAASQALADHAADTAISVAAPQNGPVNRLAALPFSAILPDDFLNACLWIEDTIGLSAHNLICCMGFETGRTFSPSIKNPGSSATGLIQFMAATAARLGTNTVDLSTMDRVHQLNYVFKYFNDFKNRKYDLSKWNLGDTYMAILYPPGIGKSDDTPIFVEGKGANYAANHGLDADKNGFVTRGECLVKISQVETEGMKHRRGGE